MRIVIYDEESLEPITVVNLPGMTERALEERRYWQFAVTRKLPEGEAPEGKNSYVDSVKMVELEFEKVSRVTLHYGEQHTWLCLTRATELAMLLEPDWLPGQRRAVDTLRERNEQLSSMLANTLIARAR